MQSHHAVQRGHTDYLHIRTYAAAYGYARKDGNAGFVYERLPGGYILGHTRCQRIIMHYIFGIAQTCLHDVHRQRRQSRRVVSVHLHAWRAALYEISVLDDAYILYAEYRYRVLYIHKPVAHAVDNNMQFGHVVHTHARSGQSDVTLRKTYLKL